MMTRPGELQTFSFENSADLVWKLYWEIARIQHASPHDIVDMKCFAFNAAVTAWQLADWGRYDKWTKANPGHFEPRWLSAIGKFGMSGFASMPLDSDCIEASRYKQPSAGSDGYDGSQVRAGSERTFSGLGIGDHRRRHRTQRNRCLRRGENLLVSLPDRTGLDLLTNERGITVTMHSISRAAPARQLHTRLRASHAPQRIARKI
jgi:hypothetical protein